jgi:hypothetical protein
MGGFRGLGVRRPGAVAVHGVGRFSGCGHGFGESLGVSFESCSFLRFGNGLGRGYGLGANGCDRRGRLGVVMVVMIVLAVMMMVMIVMVIVIMGMMMVVVTMIVVIMVAMIVVVMIVTFVLAVMLRIGVQMLALVRSALGVKGLALDRLGRGIGAFDDVAADALALTAAAGIAMARASAAVGAVLALFFGFAMGLFLGFDQRLPVGNRDLVVVGMDFAEGEEAVAVTAIFDEGGLERGFDPCDFGEIDIPA